MTFIKKNKYQNTQDVLVIFVLQETKKSNLSIKNRTQGNVTSAIFNMKKIDLDES